MAFNTPGNHQPMKGSRLEIAVYVSSVADVDGVFIVQETEAEFAAADSTYGVVYGLNSDNPNYCVCDPPNCKTITCKGINDLYVVKKKVISGQTAKIGLFMKPLISPDSAPYYLPFVRGRYSTPYFDNIVNFNSKIYLSGNVGALSGSEMTVLVYLNQESILTEIVNSSDGVVEISLP